MPFTAVLDANVLYQRMVRVPLLRAAAEGLYRPVWDQEILEEMRRTFYKNRPDIPEERVVRIIERISQISEDALTEGHEGLIPAMTNSSEDRHILAVAVHQGAQALVTWNRKHFPEAACNPYNVEVQSPDEFICHLWDLAPETMVEVLESSSPILGVDIQQLIDDLGAYVPEFSALVRESEHFTHVVEAAFLPE